VGKSQLGNPEIEATRIARPAFYVSALDVRFLDSTIELSHIGNTGNGIGREYSNAGLL